MLVYDVEIKYMIYPYASRSETCTLMILENLAEPQWIQINCKVNLLASTVCVTHDKYKYSREEKYNHTKNGFQVYCSLNQMRVKGKCFTFLWFAKSKYTNLKGNCKKIKATPFVLKNVDDVIHMSHIILASSATFPPLFTIGTLNETYLKRVILHRIMNMHRYEADHVLAAEAEGFHVCEQKEMKVGESIKGNTIFQCKKKVYISHLCVCVCVCDRIKDCEPDGLEENCIVYQNLKSEQCKEACEILPFSLSGKSHCPSLFFMTSNGVCSKYNQLDYNFSNSTNISVEAKPHFKCGNDSVIDTVLGNGLVGDCGNKAEDEPPLISLLLFEEKVHCTLPSELPCRDGHPKCFNITDICTYRLDTNGYNFPYRNGAHLEDCNKFMCNVKFKCESSYCIPWSYLCDGKWDCPNGNDENQNDTCLNESVCKYMYKCRKTKMICIHLFTVCDGMVDCPLEDDENFCIMQNISCPVTCKCLMFAIECTSKYWNLNDVEYPYIYVSLHHMSPIVLQNYKYFFLELIWVL